MELLNPVSEGTDAVLKTLWHHSDAVLCCSLKVNHTLVILYITYIYIYHLNLLSNSQIRGFTHPNINHICSIQALPVFTFANQAGLDMLETTLVALQDITLEKIFNDNGRKTLFAELPQIMQQVPTILQLLFLLINQIFNCM